MLLERMEHPAAAFVTLTYNEKNCPKDLCVEKGVLQRFFKRLRKEIYPRKIRYFACGEYGEEKFRPHYHAIIYGLFPTEGKTVEKCWPFGFIHIGSAEPAAMTYTASYVVKKWTKVCRGLEGRKPEFALMSRNPGLGFGFVERVKKSYETERGKTALDLHGWIANEIRLDGKKYKMPRYLAGKIAEQLGLTTEEKKVWLTKIKEKKEVEDGHWTATEYHKRRKARVDQESGRLLLKRFRSL